VSTENLEILKGSVVFMISQLYVVEKVSNEASMPTTDRYYSIF
jgi:hypothetical protein